MTAEELIDTYVEEVVRRLPRRQRRDVALELRSLLNESLGGRAEEAGTIPDAPLALAMLQSFGAPADVAARYAPDQRPIIEPGQAGGFIWLALGGVAFQWAVTLPAVLRAGWSGLGRWWVSWGLGAFWWPGLLVVAFVLVRWIRILAGPTWNRGQEWKPRRLDRDRIDRGRWGLAFAAAAAGVAALTTLPWIDRLAPAPVARVFAFDPYFLHVRAPFLLMLWMLAALLYGRVIAEGRWRKATRRLALALNLAACLLMLWFLTGPIFHDVTTDKAAKGPMVLFALLPSLGAIALEFYRNALRQRRARAPA